MPTDLRRRVDIAAAVAAYDGANPNAPLPRNAARLLAVMFLTEDACQRSQEAIAAEGFSRDRLPAMLRPPGARATLFGRWVSRWRVIRTSNAYGSRDPQPRPEGVLASKPENRPGTQSQEIQIFTAAPADPDNPLEAALRRLGAGIEGKLLLNGSGGQVLAS